MGKRKRCDLNSLRGDWDTFSHAEIERRSHYIHKAALGELDPEPEWMHGTDELADSLTNLATFVYNTLVYEGYGEDMYPVSGLREIIQSGGDAELWTLIRIALHNANDEIFVESCKEKRLEI